MLSCIEDLCISNLKCQSMKNLSTSQKIAVLVFRCINLIRVWSWLQNWGKLNYMDIRKSTNKKSMAWEKTNQKRKEWYLILTRITSKLLLNNDMNWLNTHKNKSPWFKLVMTQVKDVVTSSLTYFYFLTNQKYLKNGIQRYQNYSVKILRSDFTSYWIF